MPTLWDVVTNNSSLPVNSGNTFWDHLNNQAGGGGGNIYVGGVLTMSTSPALSMEADSPNLTMDLQASMTMNLETSELSVNIDQNKSMDLGN